MKLNRNSKIFLNYFLIPVVFVWLSWSIYNQVQKQPGLAPAWEGIKASFSGPLVWNLVAVLVLMLVNWAIEAIKWRISIRPIQKVSFMKAFKAILSGISFSISTPNRLGEFLGRILYMDEGNRAKTISITIVGSISQLIITLLMGSAGLIILRSALESTQLISPLLMNGILIVSLLVTIAILFFYFRLSVLVKWVEKFRWFRRFGYLVQALEEFDTKLLFKLLLLSALRFVIFVVQFQLAFYLFGVNIPWWESWWAVSISFLVLAAIPSFAIADLGLRGEIGLRLIGLFTVNKLGILLATVTIWLINLIIPAIIGSLLILGVRKLYKEQPGKVVQPSVGSPGLAVKKEK